MTTQRNEAQGDDQATRRQQDTDAGNQPRQLWQRLTATRQTASVIGSALQFDFAGAPRLVEPRLERAV